MAVLSAVFTASLCAANDSPEPSTAPGPSAAGAAFISTPSKQSPLWANRGHWNFGFQVGYMVENDIPHNITHINLLIVQPQIGLIVKNFRSGRISRFEILDEGILGNAVHPGGSVIGHALLFRFDGKPRGNVVPFLDVGAGMLHTTLNTRAPELSGRLQFLPQAGMGIQYFFKPQRALVIEYRYAHMSNASIELPNHGLNGSMVTIGFRWLRRPQAEGPRSAHHSGNPFHFLFGAD